MSLAECVLLCLAIGTLLSILFVVYSWYIGRDSNIGEFILCIIFWPFVVIVWIISRIAAVCEIEIKGRKKK